MTFIIVLYITDVMSNVQDKRWEKGSSKSHEDPMQKQADCKTSCIAVSLDITWGKREKFWSNTGVWQKIRFPKEINYKVFMSA